MMPDFNNGERFSDRELGDESRAACAKVTALAGEISITAAVAPETPAATPAQPDDMPKGPSVAYEVPQYGGGGSVSVYEGTW